MATYPIQDLYKQAEKTIAQPSTFHFARAPQNKKSLPFPLPPKIVDKYLAH